MIDLNTLWFVLLGVLLSGYAILDGFDLGVGVLHLFTKNDDERQTGINAIGPVWDGNEVWLLTFGGALFAAFPIVYATVFSAYYLALVLLLAALIFRGVSIEFRGKIESNAWKRLWDWGFGLGSLLPSILFGVAVGNILRGLPIDNSGTFTGSFIGLLNPYAVLAGLFSLSMFTLHGAVYLAMKTDSPYRDRLLKTAKPLWIVFMLLFIVYSAATRFAASSQFSTAIGNPLTWIALIVFIVSAVSLLISIGSGKTGRAFLASSLCIISVVGIMASSLYPMLVPSITDISNSLTVYNASSTPKTLTVMLVIVVTGIPLVLVYTAIIYRIFRGKASSVEHGY